MKRLDRDVVIPVLEPFRRVNDALLELLEGLSDDDWERPTVHPKRDVKDLAAHLLHGSLRRMSGLRDGYRRPGPAIASNEDLVAFIQEDNAAFMGGMRRISPGVLIELIRRYDPEVVSLFEGLDPAAEGLGVAWAGESTSPRWFDVAREYTEKWHHQQQIRDATGRPLLYEATLFEPVLQTFARGLPFAYRDLARPEGTRIAVRTEGELACGWTLVRESDGWALLDGADPEAATRLALPADLAWRVWTKSRPPAEVRPAVAVAGDPQAVEPLLGFVAIMA